MHESENGTREGKRIPGAVRRITRGELIGAAEKRLGPGYWLDDDEIEEDAPVLEGHFETLELRPGLTLHTSAARDLQSLSSGHVLQPGIRILAVVGGETELSFGHRKLRLGPQTLDPAERSKGAMVSLAEPDVFSRRWCRGARERKVSLTLTDEWMDLEASSELADFARSHLAYQPWILTPRSIELARQILEPSSLQPGLQRLRLEGHCIDLALEALSSLARPEPYGTTLREIDRRRLVRLDELLHSEEVLGCSMAEIARAVGSNTTTLQSLARGAWGCSIFERLRAIRMEKALGMLVRGGSVGEAAEIAGYGSPSNFSAAFRRHYGFTPSRARRERAA